MIVSDGSLELANHFINGGRDCLSLVAFLLTAITVHGHVPDSFRRSTIVPIPKGHNVNKSDSANFRGIALSSILEKILDNIILDRYHVQLMSCYRQFGFKSQKFYQFMFHGFKRNRRLLRPKSKSCVLYIPRFH